MFQRMHGKGEIESRAALSLILRLDWHVAGPSGLSQSCGMRGMARLRKEHLVRCADSLGAGCCPNDALFFRMWITARLKEDYLVRHIDCMHAE